MSDLTVPGAGSLEAAVDLAEGYARKSKAPATLKAYTTDWRAFQGWCATHGADSMPASPATVAAYLADQAAVLKLSTLQRRLSSISQWHKAAGLPSPTKDARVGLTLAGIRREPGRPRRKQAAPLTVPALRRMVAALDPERMVGCRDRALLLVGFAGALRRSELAGLQLSDVVDTDDGLRVTIRSSKTDQGGEGALVGVPYGSHPLTCPVRAWRAWLACSGIEGGPAWRPISRGGRVLSPQLSDRAVDKIIRRTALLAGLDPGVYSGHSLRAGLATAAATAGVSERAIMRQGRWTSLQVARGYIREGDLWLENAASAVGL